MRLRRFEGATMAEALAQVKADLGADAVILHARTAGKPGEGGRVEVTAAVDADCRPEEPRVGRDPHQRVTGVGNGYSTEPPSEFANTATPPKNGRGASSGIGATREEAPGLRPPEEPEPEGSPDALEDIRRMLQDLRTELTRAPRLRASVRPAYHQLLSQEVPAEAAREILLACSPKGRSRRKAPIQQASLHELLAGRFRVSGPIAPGRAQRAVVLVGPTGVGKTTTLAKLAGQLRHTAGLSVVLLSLDTYRIGAMAQMQIYADLLGVPLHVISTAGEMRTALAAERGADLLLVDTMGRSPYQAEGIAATRLLLREIPNLEVHLVVSATTKRSDLIEILDRFRPLRYRRLLVTKVDEARTLGAVLSLALMRGLTISYLGTGQEVPDHLEAATPRRLAALLLPEASPKCEAAVSAPPR